MLGHDADDKRLAVQHAASKIPCNTVLLADSVTQPLVRRTTVEVQEGEGRARSRGDVDEDIRSRDVVAVERPRFVDEEPNMLVARTREAKSLGLGADPAVDFGDRSAIVRVALDDVEESRRESWRDS